MRTKAALAAFVMNASLFAALVSYLGHMEVLREQAEMCLAENIYHEGRGESRGDRSLIGMITIARVTDSDPQWPKTICGVVAQDRQFSWVLDYRLATNRSEMRHWEEAKVLAHELLAGAWVKYLLPRGWECARYYKRTDGKGVSKASQKFFDTRLFPVGSFGHHTAFQERHGCKRPLPTT
jgi:hypothetical protein